MIISHRITQGPDRNISCRSTFTSPQGQPEHIHAVQMCRIQFLLLDVLSFIIFFLQFSSLTHTSPTGDQGGRNWIELNLSFSRWLIGRSAELSHTLIIERFFLLLCVVFFEFALPPNVIGTRSWNYSELVLVFVVLVWLFELLLFGRRFCCFFFGFDRQKQWEHSFQTSTQECFFCVTGRKAMWDQAVSWITLHFLFPTLLFIILGFTIIDPVSLCINIISTLRSPLLSSAIISSLVTFKPVPLFK